LAIAEGRNPHPDQDTIESCMMAVSDAEQVITRTDELAGAKARQDDLHSDDHPIYFNEIREADLLKDQVDNLKLSGAAAEDIAAAELKLTEAQIALEQHKEKVWEEQQAIITKCEMELKNEEFEREMSRLRITPDPQYMNLAWIDQARHALLKARMAEEEEATRPHPRNKDGTINIKIIATWGKDKFEQLLTHVRLSYTVQHVMHMIQDEYPEDVGFGIDLTEPKQQWFLNSEGDKLLFNRTLDDVGVDMDHTLQVVVKQAEAEAEPVWEPPASGPEKAARYQAHLFKDDTPEPEEPSDIGTTHVSVDVYDNPRLDHLGAQPHYGMHSQYSKLQHDIDATCECQTYGFEVRLDRKIGTLVEMIRNQANISHDMDIFLFHGEGVHEDHDPDRHIEGDDSRTAFWTRGDMLHELFIDHISEYGHQYVAVAKEADGIVPYHGRWVDRVDYDSDELEHHGTAGDHGSTFGKKMVHTKNYDADGDGVVSAQEFHAAGKDHVASNREKVNSHQKNF